MKSHKLTRREFIGTSCSLAAVPWLSNPQKQHSEVSLVVDPEDPVAGAETARWAIAEFKQALLSKGVDVRDLTTIPKAGSDDLCIVAAGERLPVAASILKRSRVVVGSSPEALALVPTKEAALDILLACGRDPRGLAYAILELSDRLNHRALAGPIKGSSKPNDSSRETPLASLFLRRSITEQPANSIRSILRLFASDVEDKPWFYDREFWQHYLTMLAVQRFNRFNLSLSLGYDFLRRVTDAYFLFPYPFLLSVPGYKVRVPQLPDAERDRNLATLKFISEQTAQRGLDFQLGLWMHGYEWIDSPNANYTVEGLTKETHGSYCRDALRLLLQTCPSISGVTLRTHGESGIEEGSYQFWRTVFEAVATCGRRVEIDLHPKGLDQTMLNSAIDTHQPVTVSPKFWAEHLGLPYHQTDIRQLEIPDPTKQTSRLMNLSEGARSFMRYGYGDLLREDRNWKVIHRVWPGTQRLLLWGDPASASAYSRAFRFCASNGAEIMEPLTFKGRRGSGIAGDRCAYVDNTLRTRWDWEKYEYSYRVWGRTLYNPDSDPGPWQRYSRKHFGARSNDLEASLANASRILPLVTTAHLPSAANNNYWPEMYANQSLFDAENRGSYSDTPVPRVFGNVSPLDPQLFYRINDFAEDLLRGELSGKYSPLEVAQWLDDYAEAASKAMAQGIQDIKSEPSPAFRRWVSDVLIQIGLGRFFAAKFRSGVLYRVFEKSGERLPLVSALDQYRKARDHWAEFSNLAKNVYLADVTVGELPQLHGHWEDRVPAIERDINGLATKLDTIKPTPPSASVTLTVKKILSRVERIEPACRHVPSKQFFPGKPLEVDLVVHTPAATVTLYYRHVNQAERFTSIDMERRANQYRGTIPGDYTHSAYPLQYYFEVGTPTHEKLLYPGLSKNSMSQPYFVIRAV